MAAAEADNEIEPPAEVLASMQLPDLKKVKLISSRKIAIQVKGEGSMRSSVNAPSPKRQRSPGQENQRAGAAYFDQVLYSSRAKMQLDLVDGAQFADCRVVFRLGNMEKLIKNGSLAALSIWKEAAFELPLRASRLGPKMTSEEVVMKVTDLFNASACKFSEGRGSAGAFSIGALATNAFVFSAKVENSRFLEGCRFLMRLKEDAEFSEEKVKTAASRILNKIPDEKRAGWGLCTFGARALFEEDNGAGKVFSWPVLGERFWAVAGKAEDDDEDGGEDEVCSEGGDESVKSTGSDESPERAKASRLDPAIEKAAVEKVQRLLHEFQKNEFAELGMHLAGDLTEKEVAPFVSRSATAGEGEGFFAECGVQYQPLAEWAALSLAKEGLDKNELLKAVETSGEGMQPCRGVLVPCASIESNYMRLSIDTGLRDFNRTDVVPLMLACETFGALEGPFWRKIRGKGFAYNYSLGFSLESGLLSFVLQKAMNPVSALEEARQIVSEGCGGKKQADSTELSCLQDVTALNGARSGLTYEIIAGVSTLPSVLLASYIDTIGRYPEARVQTLLARINDAPPAQIQAAAARYILPLFEGSRERPRVFSASCPENKKAAVGKSLAEVGFKFTEVGVKELASLYAAEDGYAQVRKRVLEQ